ncbi:dnaJsubfamily B member 8 [Dorcoceras hygrometricum]|uniref:DnaJsubfamily B member 8 n=1 Tax=Dorcoceras hygrometricum TaxID=472368 RepID=A0A2Z7B7C4_9LAMI|nr:dnaJsubfamily B member 8 [Dorcoceras hygrometricum]
MSCISWVSKLPTVGDSNADVDSAGARYRISKRWRFGEVAAGPADGSSADLRYATSFGLVAATPFWVVLKGVRYRCYWRQREQHEYQAQNVIVQNSSSADQVQRTRAVIECGAVYKSSELDVSKGCRFANEKSSRINPLKPKDTKYKCFRRPFRTATTLCPTYKSAKWLYISGAMKQKRPCAIAERECCAKPKTEEQKKHN